MVEEWDQTQNIHTGDRLQLPFQNKFVCSLYRLIDSPAVDNTETSLQEGPEFLVNVLLGRRSVRKV